MQDTFLKRLKSRTRYELAWLFTFLIPLGLATNPNNDILDAFIVGIITVLIMWVIVILSNFKK